VQIFAQIGAVGERPEDGIGVGRIDILAKRDDDLAALGLQRGRSMQPAPDFAPRRFSRICATILR